MASLAELLVDELDRDLSNRRRELVDLRLLVSSSTGSRQKMLARSCHVMAYAHWEGFVKAALRTYLGHLVRIGPNLGNLHYGLQGLSLRPSIKTAIQPERAVDTVAELLKSLDNRRTDVFSVDPDEVVKTGNLNAETLQTLLGCVGLDYLPEYQTRENFINEVLCGRRHRIAHGSWQPISKDDARSVASDVLDLCDEVNTQVQTAAVYEEYLLKR